MEDRHEAVELNIAYSNWPRFDDCMYTAVASRKVRAPLSTMMIFNDPRSDFVGAWDRATADLNVFHLNQARMATHKSSMSPSDRHRN